jgi:hypothetical protein
MYIKNVYKKKCLIGTRATGCKTQELGSVIFYSVGLFLWCFQNLDIIALNCRIADK